VGSLVITGAFTTDWVTLSVSSRADGTVGHWPVEGVFSLEASPVKVWVGTLGRVVNPGPPGRVVATLPTSEVEVLKPEVALGSKEPEKPEEAWGLKDPDAPDPVPVPVAEPLAPGRAVIKFCKPVTA